MAATLGLGDRTRLGSRSASPATNSELAEYISKSNRTIKLLQEELHSASQVAIRLSHKYEAKRAERDQIAEQHSAVFRHNEKLQEQLQLLCAFISQQCKQLEIPKTVAAVLAEHSKPQTADSKHPDQHPETAAAGSRQAAGLGTNNTAGQLDTARRSPRLNPGRMNAVTTTAPEPAAAAKQTALHQQVTANVRHTTATNAATGPAPAPAASASGALSRGKPPLSVAITQQPTGRIATDTSPRSPAAITSKPGSVLLTSSTSSKEGPKLEASDQQRNASAAKPAGLGLLLNAVSASSASLATNAVGRRTVGSPVAAGVASPQSPPRTGRSNDSGSTAAAAAPLSVGSGTMWPATVSDTPAADSKKTTSSTRQPQIQQQPPLQQKPGSKPTSTPSSPGKTRTSINQLSPATGGPRQQQQHWHQLQQQQRKGSPLNSPGKSERSSSGQFSPATDTGIQSLSNDAPMPSARTLTHNSSRAVVSLCPGATDAQHAGAPEHAGISAGLANTVQIASPPNRGGLPQREAVERCNLDTEDSDSSEDTSGSSSSASSSDAEECSCGDSTSTKDEERPHSTSTGHPRLLAAAADSPVQHAAPVTTQDLDRLMANLPRGSRHASASSRTNAASVASPRTSPNKASSTPSAVSRGDSLNSSSSSRGSKTGAEVGSRSSSDAANSDQEDYCESSPTGTAGPAPSRHWDPMSIQLPSTLESDTDGNSDGGASSSGDHHDSAESVEHQADDSIHGSTGPVSASASDGINIDNSSETQQEVGQDEQEPFNAGSSRLQDLQQPISIFASDTHQGIPAADQHSAAQSPVHTPTANRDNSSIRAASPSNQMEPTPAASPLQEQQLSLRSSSSFHSVAASPRSRRSSGSGSLYSACSRSTRVSQSSLGLTASLLEPDNFGLLLEQTSSGYSQYRIPADGAGSQRTQQQQEGGDGVNDWSRVKQPAVLQSTAAAAGVGSPSEADGPSLTPSPSVCRSAAAAAVPAAASAAAAVAAVSANTTAEASTESSRSDGPSSGYSNNFATARSRGTAGGAATGPATHAAIASVLTAQDSAFGSFVSEGGSIFGFVGDAFSSLQHAVSSAGNVAAAAAAVMGALPAGTHCAATEGASGTTNSRASWLQSPRGQRSVLAASSQPLHHQQQSVAQHAAQQQQWQAGSVLGAGSFGGFPPANSSNSSSGGGDDDAGHSGSGRRRSQGGRAPVLTRYFASRTRGLSKDETKQGADKLQQEQPLGTNTEKVEQRSTTVLLLDEHQQSSSTGDVSRAGSEQPQLQGFAGLGDPLVEPLGGQAVTARRNLCTAVPLDNSHSGGGMGSLSGGKASCGATGVPQQTSASTPFPGPGPIRRTFRTAGGGAPPTSAAFGVGFGQSSGFGCQPQPFLFGTPFQQPQQQPQAAVTQAAPFTFGATCPTAQQQPPQPASLAAQTFVFGGPAIGQQDQGQHPGTAAAVLPTHSAGSSRASSRDGGQLSSAQRGDSEGLPASKGDARQSNTFDVLAGDSDTYDIDNDGGDGSSWEETSDDE